MQTKIFQERLFDSLERFAGNTAVEYGNERVTYAELDERSDRVGCRMMDRGIQAGTFIGILTDDRLELVTLLIGVMKAGCVIVPLHSGYPDKRIENMILVTDLQYIFCDETNARRFTGFPGAAGEGPEFIVYREIEKQQEPLRHGRIEYGDVSYDAEAPLYIHFTSGTTGMPKAILGKNKSLRQFLEWEIDTFAIDSGCRVAQLTVPGFDPLLRDIFAALLTGGVVCIPGDKDIVLIAEELKAWVNRQEITLIHCVPSQFRLLSSRPLDPGWFKALKYVIMAGENINPLALRNWYEVFGERIGLANCYGTSEATMFKTCYLIRKTDIHKERIPVGKPIRGARIIILDEQMNVCEEMEPGEIYIRTPYMSCGYYNDSRMNEAAFIPNPFNSSPDDLLHKTGDQGMFLPDGNIELLGRMDRQVKIRGNRIELGEIECVLIQYPGIEEAVVTRKEAGDNELLAAYIVGSGDQPAVDTSSLEDFLKDRLPAYMIPVHFTGLAKIPRNAHGKIDYSALPDPLLEAESDVMPPRDETERRLAEIWSDILGIDNISINSNFFKTGGNSLNLMTLTHRIHKDFDVKLSLSEIFRNPTIARQAELVRAVERAEFTGIRHAGKKSYYMLSAAQKRMYILNGFDRDSTNYNLPMVVVLTGSLDVERVQGTFKKMVDRHESFRTGFETVDGNPVQRIYEPGEIDFKIEYDEAGSRERKAGIREQAINRFIRPFDLTKAPLLRVGLIFLGEETHILMVDMHHIISDGTSLGVFRREFMALYAGEELPSLSIHYKDYAEWQNTAEQKEKIRCQEEYWVKQFSGGVPVLDLPTDYPRPRQKGPAGDRLYFEVGEEETAALNRMALAAGTTLYTVLLAVYFTFLSKISGQEDIVIGTPAAGRLHADVEPVIGMFVNTLSLRNYPQKEKSFAEFLQEVNTRTLEAFENQDYQFEDLVEKLDVKRDLSRSPLFDVMFTLQNIELTEIQVPGLKLSSYEHENKTAKFDLLLLGFEKEDRLGFSLEYSTELFKEDKIDRFTGYFRDVIAIVLRDMDIKLGDIHLLSTLISPKPEISQEIRGDFAF